MNNPHHSTLTFRAIMDATEGKKLNLSELTDLIISTAAYPYWISPSINDGLLKVSEVYNARMDGDRILLDVGFHPEFKSLIIFYDSSLMQYMFIYSSDRKVDSSR